jgi:hypothetical protein
MGCGNQGLRNGSVAKRLLGPRQENWVSNVVSKGALFPPRGRDENTTFHSS